MLGKDFFLRGLAESTRHMRNQASTGHSATLYGPKDNRKLACEHNLCSARAK